MEIKKEYKKMFHHSLYDELKNEFSKDYSEFLLKIVGKD